MGALFGQALSAGVCVFLQGQLGAGKTTLVRGLLRGLGFKGNVKSPTYTLVEPYKIESQSFFHFDLYRLGDPEELEYIGIRDYFSESTICIVEWPDRGQGYLPVPDLLLKLAVEARGRRMTLEATTKLGENVLNSINQIIGDT